MASFRYAISEFELFISWYLQYARSQYPKTYQDIISNTGLKKLFVFLDQSQARLSSLYDQHRSEILKQFGKRLQVRGNFIYNTATLSGKGLYDQEVAEMASLLKMNEHRILEKLGK